jgi:hypothetical protein
MTISEKVTLLLCLLTTLFVITLAADTESEICSIEKSRKVRRIIQEVSTKMK